MGLGPCGQSIDDLLDNKNKQQKKKFVVNKC